ncbi:hypothetical protein QFC19_000805 [Naganishia cerealis]|uniref:Uncharacterized protein n=1 Tax=Naganishia cerealis TaxID=610337 RepID=A0ACC2WME1_9TREE|nr:hypothetical protein QFC19_000805 [Naganishia cerealis]
MTSCAASTRLISKEWQFKPSVGVQQYASKWRQAEEIATARLTSLEQYQDIPDLDFLHQLDDLVAFVEIQIGDAEFWRYYHPEDAMRKEGESAGSAMERLELKISSSPLLAKQLAKVELSGLDKESQRFATFAQRDRKRAGALLEEEERNKFLAISNEVQDIQRRFLTRIVDDDSHILVEWAIMATMPPDFQDSHPKDPMTGLAKIAATGGDYKTFLEYCEDDKYAEQLFKSCQGRAPDNEEDLRRIMELRYQQAKILGYASFAHYAMETGMLTDPDVARNTILETSNMAKPSCEQEMASLSAVLKSKGRELKVWNTDNATQLFLSNRFATFNPFEARKYFPFKKVVASAMGLLGEIFSVDFREARGVDTWHASVQVFDVFDLRPATCVTKRKGSASDGEGEMLASCETGVTEPVRLGRLFLDVIARNNKGSHAMMSGLRIGTRGDSILIPCANLGGSFASSADAFLNFKDSATLLHELGHCVHFLLAQNCSYYRFNGIRNEIDFGEVPSQLLEELLRHPEVFERIATDDSGKVIPREYLNALICQDELNKSTQTRTQNVFALLSLDLHSNLDAEGKFIGSTTQLWEAICRDYHPFGQIPGHRMQHSFQHLIDYDCRYYTYQHSLAIVKDLASKFMRCVPNDPEDIGYNYRKTILEPGSSKDASELIRNFLGREYTMEAYYRWLDDRPFSIL